MTWHWARPGIPGMWKPFVLIDAVMGVLFVWAWAVLRDRTGREQGH